MVSGWTSSEVVWTVAFSTILALSLLGNSLVLWTVLAHRSLQARLRFKIRWNLDCHISGHLFWMALVFKTYFSMNRIADIPKTNLSLKPEPTGSRHFHLCKCLKNPSCFTDFKSAKNLYFNNLWEHDQDVGHFFQVYRWLHLVWKNIIKKILTEIWLSWFHLISNLNI